MDDSKFGSHVFAGYLAWFLGVITCAAVYLIFGININEPRDVVSLRVPTTKTNPPPSLTAANTPVSTSAQTSAVDYTSMGWSYANNKKRKDAISCFRKAINMNPNDSNAYCGMGWSYLVEKQYSKAYKNFNKALDINKNDEDAYFGLAFIYNEKGQYDDAIRQLNILININPEDSGAYNELAYSYYNRACIYNEQGLYDQAISDLNKVIKIKPDYTNAHEKLEWSKSQKTEQNTAPGTFSSKDFPLE